MYLTHLFHAADSFKSAKESCGNQNTDWGAVESYTICIRLLERKNPEIFCLLLFSQESALLKLSLLPRVPYHRAVTHHEGVIASVSPTQA